MTNIAANVQTAIALFDTAMQGRADFEKSHNHEKTLATIEGHRRSLTKNVVAFAYFAKSGEDFAFINREIVANKRFNEKALVKVFEIAESIAANGNRLSKIDARLIESVAAKKKPLTQKAMQHILAVAHKYSASTAATQVSSFLNALRVFGLVSEKRDDEGNDVYEIKFSDERLAFLAK